MISVPAHSVTLIQNGRVQSTIDAVHAKLLARLHRDEVIPRHGIFRNTGGGNQTRRVPHLKRLHLTLSTALTNSCSVISVYFDHVGSTSTGAPKLCVLT